MEDWLSNTMVELVTESSKVKTAKSERFERTTDTPKGKLRVVVLAAKKSAGRGIMGHKVVREIAYFLDGKEMTRNEVLDELCNG
jgi:hypothetical protein